MVLALVLVGLAVPVLAQEAHVYCDTFALECQETIPQLFYEGYPDSLLNLIYDWEDLCGMAEPITRTLILGAIWDGAFDEDLYAEEIIDFLIDYESSSLGDFDVFTASLADQLLPHTIHDSLEQFFCLFYANRTEEAWALLEGQALKETYLKRIYDWERERISLERRPFSYLGTVGFWMPTGNLSLAGNHFVVGGAVESRKGPWMGRLTLDLLIGRAKYPYMVDQPEFSGRSDRFNSVTLAAEGGYTPWSDGQYSLDVYGGAGVGWLAPFMEEKVALFNFKGLVGVGARVDLGPTRKWFTGLDVRREWLTNGNGGGTPLDGGAWSFRLAFGYNRNHDLDRRLEALGE